MILCPDCLKVLRNIDYIDQYCEAADMQVGVEEHVCLSCGVSVYKLVNIRALDNNEFIGRQETIEYTCFSEKDYKDIPQDLLLNVVEQHYINLHVSLCRKLYKRDWVPALEIILWEAVSDKTIPDLSSHFSEFEEIRLIASKLKVWLINTAYWNNMKDTGLKLVSDKKWKNMLKNKTKLLSVDELDNTGKP